MKKLIAMIGAVAMSFGLFADAPAPFAISYEANETAAGVSGGAWTPSSPWTWNGDPISVITNLTRVLPYEGSGSKARRDGVFLTVTGGTDNYNFADLSTGSDELSLAVASGNLYLDQLVKFTGFEDPQTNLVAGTKIAVWMSEFENDNESTSTNLYITCGKNVDGKYEQVALQIEGTYELNTWYRLTVKSLGDIFDGAPGSTPRAGFLVWVNGNQATCKEAKGLLGLDAEMIKDTKKRAFYDAGRLFPAIAADATFTSVGYQGIGAIDDIIVDAEGPGFCVETVETVDVTFTTIGGAIIAAVVDSEGTVVQNPDGTYTVKPGALTVTLAAAEGHKLFGTLTYNTSTDVAVDGVINIAATETTAAEIVAKKNDTVDLAESELYTVLGALVENDTVETISTCNVTNGEAVTLYSFTPNTTITATAAGWDVFVGNYDADDGEGGVLPTFGMLTAYADIDADFALNVGFEDGVMGMFGYMGTAINGQLAITNGQAMTVAAVTVGDGALLKAANFTSGVAITLVGTGKFVTQTDLASMEMGGMIVDGAGMAVVPTAEAGWYTYALSDVPPEKIEYVTFTVTYDTAKVENVTVKTNGANVVDVEGVYTVESNAVVTVAATAKEGYQNVTITGDNVTVDAGVFKADKASSVITIAAEEIPLLTYDITFATVENGTLETSVTNSIAAGTTVTVIVTPATGYERTEITTNGTAITGTSFEMPAVGVEIGATFTLQPVDPETPKNYDNKDAADAAAAAINANKPTMIKTPDGADASEYTALFTAVVKANNDVVVELNEGGTNALKTAAANIETAVAGQLDDIAAATAGSRVSVTVTGGVQNGFWYGVAATADLTTMDSAEPTEWVQAMGGGVTIKATKPATGNAAFFQTRAKVKSGQRRAGTARHP